MTKPKPMMINLIPEKIIAAPKKKKRGLSNKTINIIRTTQRNNIELTSIADNKANVLLSVNALMITGLVPILFSYLDIILEKQLYIPVSILAATCFITIYMAARVLKPSNFDAMRVSFDEGSEFSPFFFGNFYKMEAREYYDYMKDSLSDPKLIKAHLAQDLYYVGQRLGQKMKLIRIAFNLFILGIFLTMISMALALIIV